MTRQFQTAFGAGVLAPSLQGRADQPMYDFALAEGLNVICLVQGGAINRSGTIYIGEVDNSAEMHRLVPFLRDEDERFMLVFGDQTMEAVDGLTYIETSPGTRMNVASPYASGDLGGLAWAQSVDVMFMASAGYPAQIVTRTAFDNYSIAEVDFSVPARITNAGIFLSHNDGVLNYYAVTAVLGDGAGFSFPTETAPFYFDTASIGPDLSIAGRNNQIVFSFETGALSYRIYRFTDGYYGFIGEVLASAGVNNFFDFNYSPDITITPPVEDDLFPNAAAGPGTVAMGQQRLIYGGGDTFPERFLASNLGGFTNFSRSQVTIRPTDRVKFDVIGPEVSRIKHVAELNDVIVFTSSGEHVVSGASGTLDAASPLRRQVGFSGAGDVAPLGVDTSILFVTKTSRNVRELFYTGTSDRIEQRDVSLKVPHFFRGRSIKEWAFARNPHRVMWAVMDDGSVLSMTYQRDQEIEAWCEHDFGGFVESVGVLTDTAFDRVYFIVRRTIDGQTKRYVEMLARREANQANVAEGWFLDCALSYSGAAETAIGGLGHLEGETVSAFGVDVSGEPFSEHGLTVVSGSVTLSTPATQAVVGLRYMSRIKTLPPYIQTQNTGDLRGEKYRISQVVLQLEATRGVKVGAKDDAMVLIDTLGMDEQDGLFTGFARTGVGSGWRRAEGVTAEQKEPFAMHVLGAVPEYEL